MSDTNNSTSKVETDRWMQEGRDLKALKSGPLRFLGMVAAVTALNAAPVYAASDQKNEVYEDWVVRCVTRENLPPCDMVQLAKHRESGEQVMQFSLAYSGEAEVYGVQILLPLGVLLSGGVSIKIDDGSELNDFKFTRCEAQGCFVERIVKVAELEPFQVGSKGVVAVINREAQPLVVPLSLKGFSKALVEVTQRNRYWAKKVTRASAD